MSHRAASGNRWSWSTSLPAPLPTSTTVAPGSSGAIASGFPTPAKGSVHSPGSEATFLTAIREGPSPPAPGPLGRHMGRRSAALAILQSPTSDSVQTE